MDKIKAKKLLFDITNIFTKYRIKHAIIAGLFLGAIRERDFIDWDNDIDIAVFNPFWCNYKKINKIFTALNKKNIEIINLWNNVTLSLKRENIKVNICFLHKGNKNYYLYSSKGKSVFPKKCFDGLIRRKFLGKKFYFPAHPNLYFTQVYGKDWKVPKDTKKCYHQINSKMRKKKIILRTVFTYGK